MSCEIELSSAPRNDLAEVTELAVPSELPDPVNPLRVIHAALRGRYLLTCVIAAIGLTAGALVGFYSKPPTFRSTGIVLVHPNLPRILYQSEQNTVMPMFEAFLESQVSILQSRPVIDMAMASPDWRSLKRPLSTQGSIDFAQSLVIEHPKNSELITINFTDVDPNAAMVAVRAVIDAYQKGYNQSDSENGSQRIQVLEGRRTELADELQKLNDRIKAIANEFGSDSLSEIYEFKLGELNKVESQLHLTQTSYATAGDTATTRPADGLVVVEPEAQPTADEYEFRRLLDEKLATERRVVELRATFGDNHPLLIRTRVLLDALGAQLHELATHSGPTASPAGAGGHATASIIKRELAKASEANLEALYRRLKEEVVDLGRKKLQIENLRADAVAVRTKLDETKERIEQLSVEARAGEGRIFVSSEGDRPLLPVSDKRRVYAAAGGLGLGGMGVGIVVLCGLVGGRLRNIADTEDNFRRQARLLGVLPTLPQNLDDPERAALAARAVHQVRAMLQRPRGADGQRLDGFRTFAVTSPSPEAGKTALTLALGVSFAAAGAKVLLVDCDIVGGGLTAQTDKIVRRRLEQVLRSLGLLTDEQLAYALEIARKCGHPVGEVAVKFGFLTAQALKRALDVQEHTPLGLREVLNGEPLPECVMRTGIPGLSILSLGSAGSQHIGRLSASAVRRIAAQSHGQFDVLLIDTGPILGSLEAAIVCAEVDEVVLVVGRGERRALANRATEMLDTIGAKLAGVVFNQAESADVMRSGYGSSRRLSPSRPTPAAAEPVKPARERSVRLGPIASAVAALTEEANDSQ